MKWKNIIFFTLTGFLFFPQKTQADVFKFLGARPAGMGGAFVAVAEGALAQYWNPAGLGMKDSTVDVHFAEVGAAVEATKDLLEKADNISELADKIDGIQNKTGSEAMNIDDYKDFVQALNDISELNDPGLGVLGDVHAGLLDVRVWKFAVSVNNYTEFSADPFMDLNNINLLDTGDANGGIDIAPTGGNTSDPSADLIAARDDLAAVIGDLTTRAGMDTAGLTSQEAANAIINEAAANNQDTSTINDTINNIKSNYDAVKSILPAAGSGSFDDNETNLTVRGASIFEVSLGMGGSFPFQKDIPVLSDMLVGGNLKALKARVGYARINVLDENADVGDVVDDMTNNTKDSTTASLDLGILYDKKKDWRFRSGIVFRNLTGPSFDAPVDDPNTASVKEGEGGTFEVDTQIRLGLACWPLERWTIAADIDLTENSTALPGYDSRVASFGTEFKLLNSKNIDLALRAGLYKNLAESESALAYTAGLGFTALHVTLDIAGAISSKTVKAENGRTIPASASVSLGLSVVF